VVWTSLSGTSLTLVGAHSLIHSPTLTACFGYQVRSNALHTPIPQLVVREGAKIEALEDQRQIAMVICRCPTTSG